MPQDAGSGQFAYNPGATQQWDFSETAQGQVGQAGHEAAAAPGHDVTGQWSIPVADGDLPDESGEFTTSSLVEQWGGTPPATLPGGAPAPWATQPTGQPWGQQAEAAATDAYSGERTAPDPHEQSAASAPEFTPEPPAEVSAEGSSEPAQASQAAPGAGEVATDAQGAAEAAESPAEASVDPATAEGDPTPAEAGDSAPEAAEDPAQAASGDVPVPNGEEHPLASYVLRVNGVDRPVSDAWIGESLLYVLRERLGLAGAKDGCSQGECGACNVQVDGRLVASCLVPAVTAAGSEVRTVEGLAEDGQPSDVQRALARCGAVQCGFCVPGMAMTVHDLLEGNPAPTEMETRQALCGNLCRCSGYRGVVEAVKEVVAEREAHAAVGDGEQDGDEPRIPHQAGPGAGGVNPSAFEPRGGRGPHDQAYGQDGGQA